MTYSTRKRTEVEIIQRCCTSFQLSVHCICRNKVDLWMHGLADGGQVPFPPLYEQKELSSMHANFLLAWVPLLCMKESLQGHAIKGRWGGGGRGELLSPHPIPPHHVKYSQPRERGVNRGNQITFLHPTTYGQESSEQLCTAKLKNLHPTRLKNYSFRFHQRQGLGS